MLAPNRFYQGRPLNVAHRGARRQAPENTLPAFQLAMNLGVDGIELDARLSQSLELYYFGGMTYREIAHALEVSPATVDRDLRFARAWLRRELADEDSA